MKSPDTRRPTLGFLIDWTENPYQFSILEGVTAYATERDVNLLCFEGGTLHCPLYVAGGASLNAPFELATPETIDGLIILAAPIGRYCTPQQLRDFCSQYQPLPTVTIGFETDGIPSLVIDNEAGFVSLLEHLIQEHGYTRFAFVNGTETNPDAMARREIFTRTLQAHGIDVDPRLSYSGDFMPESGAQAVRVLLDDRKAEFQVLVAANDHMAIGAMRELSRRGIGVPVDVAVTGFDDLDLSSTSDPPLTTVAQPLREQGRIACEMVLDLMDGRPVPRRRVLPTRLVVRDSCWFQCSLTPRTRIKLAPSEAPQPSFSRLRAAGLCAIDELIRDKCSEEEQRLLHETAGRLLDAVAEGADKGQPDAVASPVRRAVDDYLAHSKLCVAFHELVTMLRQALLPMATDLALREMAEEVSYQAILCYGNKSWQVAGSRYEHVLSLDRAVTHFRTDLSLSLEPSDQLEIITRGLPQLGITRCLVFLYAGEPSQPYAKGRLLLAFDETGRKSVDSSAVFDLPQGFRAAASLVNSTRLSLVVEPLGDVGFMVLQMTDEQGMKIYTATRDTISFALRSSVLLQQVQAQKDSLTANVNKLKRAMEGFIETMGVILETRDPYTAGHQRRVSDLASRIAQEMGLPANQTELIRMAGLVHDIGKIGLPSEILNKPGKLQELEFGLIKTHAAVAYNVLSNVDFPWPIADIVHQHHERLDGSGYPLGLAGDSIRMEARILAVADVVEAMASHRPYRPALGLERALQEIAAYRGVRYDSQVVDVCLRLFNELGYRLRGDGYAG